VVISVEEARRLALADAAVGGAGPAHLVVIGCGSLLRGDDAVGPILIRRLWQSEEPVPDGVLLVDGGTAGMDVAFKMNGAGQVILIDASRTGAEPGTIYRVPGDELASLPPLEGLHTHQFRWDHALAFGRWLLGDRYPTDVTVYLIEAAQTEPGAELSGPVAAAMIEVAERIRAEWAPADDGEVTVELTAEGYARLSAEVAARWFPGDSLVALRRDGELWLVPLVGQQAGGLLLKQRNARGDRSALVWEALTGDDPAGGTPPTGVRPARWDADQGALRVDVGS
jgi:hydrogenase maturation protease